MERGDVLEWITVLGQRNGAKIEREAKMGQRNKKDKFSCFESPLLLLVLS